MRAFAGVCLAAFACGTAFAQDPPPPAPQKYALIIGLNDNLYAGSLIKKLKYAVNDAEQLKDALEDQGYKATILRNEDARRENIVAELSKFASIANESDTFLLYYAGHGVRNKRVNHATYWLAYEANLAALDARGIRLQHLLDYLRDIKAGKKLILLDHCFSGEIVTGTADGPDNSREGVTDLKIERGSFDITDVSSPGAAGTRGFAVIAASDRDAFEVTNLGHGVFTAVLLDALRTNAADTNGDGRLSLNELKDHLGRNVPTRSQATVGRQQTIVESATGTGLSQWIVGPSLFPAAAKVKEIVEAYQARITAWTAQQSLTSDQKTWLSARLNDWYEKTNTNQPMSRRDVQVISNIRDIVESMEVPDDRKPAYLVELVQN